MQWYLQSVGFASDLLRKHRLAPGVADNKHCISHLKLLWQIKIYPRKIVAGFGEFVKGACSYCWLHRVC